MNILAWSNKLPQFQVRFGFVQPLGRARHPETHPMDPPKNFAEAVESKGNSKYKARI